MRYRRIPITMQYYYQFNTIVYYYCNRKKVHFPILKYIQCFFNRKKKSIFSIENVGIFHKYSWNYISNIISTVICMYPLFDKITNKSVNDRILYCEFRNCTNEIPERGVALSQNKCIRWNEIRLVSDGGIGFSFTSGYIHIYT